MSGQNTISVSLSSDSAQFSFKLQIHWVLAESSPWPRCVWVHTFQGALKRSGYNILWTEEKTKTHSFLPKFFFVLILWAIRLAIMALQLGSIHCLRGTAECCCCSKSHVCVSLSWHVMCIRGRCRWWDRTWDLPSKINVLSPRQHLKKAERKGTSSTRRDERHIVQK